jgi:uncharacterized OB-fold protein
MSNETSTIDGVLAGRVLPVVHEDNRPFFEAAARGELLLQRCKETGKFQYYPRACSIYTFGEVEWVKASGKGKVYTYTVVRRNPADPVFSKLVPYVIASIDLPEGVRMFGNIVGCAPEDVHIDMDVEVYFPAVNEAGDLHLPFWRPAA